jgi:hypothetical protein
VIGGLRCAVEAEEVKEDFVQVLFVFFQVVGVFRAAELGETEGCLDTDGGFLVPCSFE